MAYVSGGCQTMELPDKDFQHGPFLSWNCPNTSKTSSIKVYRRPTRNGINFNGFTDNECEESLTKYLQSKFEVETKEKEEKQLERQIFLIDGLSCSDCSLTFSSSSHLEKHQTFCKSLLPSNYKPLLKNKDVFRESSSGMLICPKCPILCSNTWALRKHLLKCREANQRLTYCQKSAGPAVQECSIVSSKADLNAVPSQVNGYSCVECLFKAENLKALLPHMQSHYLSDLVCSNCNSLFASVKMLLNHHQICTSGDCKLQCSDCGNVFSSFPSLESHLQTCPKTQCLKCAQHVGRESFFNHVMEHLPKEWSIKNLNETADTVMLRLSDRSIGKEKYRSNDALSSAFGSTGNVDQNEETHCKNDNFVGIKKLRKKRKQGRARFCQKNKKACHSSLKISTKTSDTEVTCNKILVHGSDSNALNLETTLLSKEAHSSTSSGNSMWFTAATETEIFEPPKIGESAATCMSSIVNNPLTPANGSMGLDRSPTLVTEHFEIEDGFRVSDFGEDSDTYCEEQLPCTMDAAKQHLAHDENCDKSEHLFPQKGNETEDENDLKLTIVNVEGGTNLFNWDDESDSNSRTTDFIKEDNATLIPEEFENISDVIVREQGDQVLVHSCSPSNSNEDGDSGIDATEDSSNQDKTEVFDSCVNSVVTQQSHPSMYDEDPLSRDGIPIVSNILHSDPLNLCKDDHSPSDIIKSLDSNVSDDVQPIEKSLPTFIEDASPNKIIISNEPSMSSAVYLSSLTCENEIVVENVVPLEDPKPKRKYSVLLEHNYALPEGQTVPWFVRQAMKNKLRVKKKSVITAENEMKGQISICAQSSQKKNQSSKPKKVKTVAGKKPISNTNLQKEKFSSNSGNLRGHSDGLQDAVSSSTFPSKLDTHLEFNPLLISARDQIKHCKQEKLNLLMGIVPNAEPSVSIQSTTVERRSSMLKVNKAATASSTKFNSLEHKVSQNLSQGNEQSTNSSYLCVTPMKDSPPSGGSVLDSSKLSSKSIIDTKSVIPPAAPRLSRQHLKERSQKTPIDLWKKFLKKEQSMLSHGFKQIATVLPRKENSSKIFSLQKNIFSNCSAILDPNSSNEDQSSVDKALGSEISESSRPCDSSMSANTLMFIVTSDGSLLPHPNFISSPPICSDHIKENLPPPFNEGPCSMSEGVTSNESLTEPLVNKERKEFFQLSKIPHVLSQEEIMLQSSHQEKNHPRVVMKDSSLPVLTQDCSINSTHIQQVQSEIQLHKQDKDSKPALLEAHESTVPNLNKYNVVLLSDADSDNGSDEGDLCAFPTAEETDQVESLLSEMSEQKKNSEVHTKPHIDEDEHCPKSHVFTTATKRLPVNETDPASSKKLNSCDERLMGENLSGMNPLKPIETTGGDSKNTAVIQEDLVQSVQKSEEGHSQDFSPAPLKPFKVVGMHLCSDLSREKVLQSSLPCSEEKSLNEEVLSLLAQDHSSLPNPIPPKPSEVAVMNLCSHLPPDVLPIQGDCDQKVSNSSLPCSQGKSAINETSTLHTLPNDVIQNPASKSESVRINENLAESSSTQNSSCCFSSCLNSSKMDFKASDGFPHRDNELFNMKDSIGDATQTSDVIPEVDNELFSSFISASEEEVMEAVQLAVSQLFGKQICDETTMGQEIIPTCPVDEPVCDSNDPETAPSQNSDNKLFKSASGCLQVQSPTTDCGGIDTLNFGDPTEKLEGKYTQSCKKRSFLIWSPFLNHYRKLMSEMKIFRRIKHGRQGMKRSASSDRFSCTNCSEWFYNPLELQNHVCLMAILREKIYSKNSDKLLEVRADSMVEDIGQDKNILPVSESMSLFETFLQMKTHVRKRWFDCDKCETRCKSFSALLDHKAIVHTEKSLLQCHVCGKEFSKLQKLAVHFAIRHKTKTECSEVDVVSTGSQCEQESTSLELCEQEAPAAEVLGQSCGSIDLTIMSAPGEFQRGVKASDQVEHPMTLSKEINKCHICQKTFNGKSGLVSHLNQAHAPVYKCPVCFRRFTYLHKMKTHFMQHNLTLPAVTEVLPSKPMVLEGNTNTRPVLLKKNDYDDESSTTKIKQACDTFNSDVTAKQLNENVESPMVNATKEIVGDSGADIERCQDANSDITSILLKSEALEISHSSTKMSSLGLKGSSNSSLSSTIDGESTVSGNNLINTEKDKHINKRRKKTKWRIIQSSSSDENSSPEKQPKSPKLSNGCSFQNKANCSTRPLVLSLSKVKRPEHQCDVCSKSFKKKLLLVQHQVDVHKNASFTSQSCLISLSDLHLLNLHLEQCKNNVQGKEQSSMDEQHDTAPSPDLSLIKEDIVQSMSDEMSPSKQEKSEFCVPRQTLENPQETKKCISSTILSQTLHVGVVKKICAMNLEPSHCNILLGTQFSEAQSGLEANNESENRSADSQFPATGSDCKDTLLLPHAVLSSQPSSSKAACISGGIPEESSLHVKETHYPELLDAAGKDKLKISTIGDWKCEECTSHFSSKGYLERHMIKHHGAVSKFPCALCDKFFTDVRSYRFHKKSKHSNVNSLDSPQAGKLSHGSDAVLSSSKPTLVSLPASGSRLGKRKGKQKIRKCEKCKKLFRRDIDLTRHHRRVHKKPAVVCEVCQLHVGNYKLLKVHQSKAHTVSSQCYLSSEPDHSEQCQSLNTGEGANLQVGDAVPDSNVFENHPVGESLPSEDSAALLNCSDCPLTYKTFSCLKRHRILVHSEPANHYCGTCGKGFSYPHSLKNHEMTHSRGKWKSKRTDKVSDNDSFDDASIELPSKKQCDSASAGSTELIENDSDKIDASATLVENLKRISSCNSEENAAKGSDGLSTVASTQHGPSSSISPPLLLEKSLIEKNCGLQSTQYSEVPGQEVPRKLSPVEGIDMIQKSMPVDCSLMETPTVNVPQNTFISNTYYNIPNVSNLPYYVKHPGITSNYDNSALLNPGPAAFFPYQAGSINPIHGVPIPYQCNNSQPMLCNPGSSFSNLAVNYRPCSSLNSKLSGFCGNDNPWAPPSQNFSTFNICTMCGLNLPNWYALQEHYYVTHPYPSLCMDGYLQQQYQASPCSQIVPSGWLNQPQPQLATISTSGLVSGEDTASFEELKSHSVVHCSVCGVCFPSLISLQEHYKTHMAS